MLGMDIKMDKLKIIRINKLSEKSKTTDLTQEEKEEQQGLRQEYINAFKNNLKSTLDSIVIENSDLEHNKLHN